MSATFFWELASAEDAIAAARKLHALGYRSLEAFTPYDVPELDALLGHLRVDVRRLGHGGTLREMPWRATLARLDSTRVADRLS
jgi:hypothetical protein